MGVSKILVVGAIQGKFKKAFEKIGKLQTKQNFDLAIIVGDVFSSSPNTDLEELKALLDGIIKVPLATYFSVGDSAFPEVVKQKLEADEDICSNLFYLGRKGTFTTTEGIRIVTLGGRLAQAEANAEKLGKCDPKYLEIDARGLHGANSAHILLTNDWPSTISAGSKIELPAELKERPGSQPISNLCQALKPWYHFSSSPEAIWEREPFMHVLEYDSLEQPEVTRFKSLPSVAASTKEWMTAFSLDTSRPPPTLDAPTQSPFVRSSPPRKRPAVDDGHQWYERGGRQGQSGRHNKRPRKDRFDNSDCFMCLNKPEFKQHMVVSIGDESVVTTQRGPLSTMSTFPQLSYSGHAMIIPLYHAADEQAHGKRSLQEVTNEFQEMSRFRQALSKMVGSKSQGQLGTVCWEVHRNGIRHHHWSLIACSAEQIKKGLVEAAFKVSRERHEYPAFEVCEPEDQLPSKSDYFRVWTWASDPVEMADVTNGDSPKEKPGVTKSMFLQLPEDLKFNIWFGREVMGGLLKLEDRVNWMHALLRKDGSEQLAEEEDAEGLKKDFEGFDFAME